MEQLLELARQVQEISGVMVEALSKALDQAGGTAPEENGGGQEPPAGGGEPPAGPPQG